MFLLAFVARSLRGHWRGFMSQNYIVWPIFFLMNVFIALKGTHLSHLMIKPTKLLCAQQRLRSAWASIQSESSLCAEWVAKDPSFLHMDSEDSDQPGHLPSLIWVFAGRTTTLLVLLCRRSFLIFIWRLIKLTCSVSVKTNVFNNDYPCLIWFFPGKSTVCTAVYRMPVERGAAIQLGLLLLVVPAQYFISQWFTSTESQRSYAIKK